MNKPDIAKLVAAALKTESKHFRKSELQCIRAGNNGQHGELKPLPKPTRNQLREAFKDQRLNWWRALFNRRVTLAEAAGMLLGFSESMARHAVFKTMDPNEKIAGTNKSKRELPLPLQTRPISSGLVTAFTDMRGDVKDWRATETYRPADLIEWAKENGFVADEVLEAWEAYQAETKKTQTKTVSNDGPDYKMLASRDQLIKAFGAFTGVDATWFKNLKDTPKLRSARKVTGKGGRGHIAEPLFCPYEVMDWLIDPKRRKGKSIQPYTAWRILETHFPTVYNTRSIGDPRKGVD
jgi:hypothetical protein